MNNEDLSDLSNIVPGERVIELKHPGTKEPLGVKWTIMSADDPRLKRAQRRLIDQRQERQRKNKIMTAEEMESGMIQLLAQTVTGWDWGERKFNGEIPAFSTRKAIEILTKTPWIFDQLNDEVGDTAAFF